ncbi:MAG: PAS domain S-box protein [bacterium]|nr:PAS domain S-box protein [bacterium]
MRPSYEDLISRIAILEAQLLKPSIQETTVKEPVLRASGIFHSLGVACAVYEAVEDGDQLDFIIRHYNEFACKLDDLRSEDLIGRSLREVFPKILEEHDFLETFEDTYRTGEIHRFPIVSYTVEGREVWRENIFSRSLDGRSVIVVFFDVTAQKDFEQALLLTETQLRQVTDNMTDLIVVLNAGYRITYASPSHEKVLGYTAEEIVNRSLMEHVHPDDVPRVRATMNESIRNVSSGKCEIRLQCKDANYIWIETIGSPIFDDSGEFNGFVLSSRNIEERKQAEKALRTSEVKYRSLLEKLPQNIIAKDRNSAYLACNTSYADDLGIKPEEIVGKTDYDFFPEELANKYRADDQSVINSGKTIELEESYLVDGKELIVNTVKAPLRDENDNIIGIQGIFWDITDRKRTEDVQREHVRFLESLSSIDRALHSSLDLNTMLTSVIDTVFELFESDRAWLIYPCDPAAPTFHVPVERCRPEYPGGLILDLTFPISPSVQVDMEDALGATGPVTYGPGNDKDLGDKEEDYNVLSQMFMGIRPKTGSAWLFGLHQCSHARVWSDRERNFFNEIGKRIADGLSSLLLFQELEKSEERYRGLVESSNDWIWEVTLEGIYAYSSPQTEEIIGYKPEELIGRSLFDLLAPEEIPRIGKVFKESAQSGQSAVALEKVVLHKDGRRIILETTGIPVFDKSGALQGFRGVNRDVTERKQAVEELRSNERQLSLLMSNMSDMVSRHLPDSTITYVSPSCVELTGYRPEELLGTPGVDYVYPDHVSEVQSTIAEATARHDQTCIVQHIFIRKDGTQNWVESVGRLLYGPDGTLEEIHCSVRDISDRMQVEAARQEQVRFLEGMGRIDQVIRKAGNPDMLLNDVIKATFKLFECDRSWLLHPCDPEGSVFRIPVEANKPEYPGGKAQDLPIPISPSMRGDMTDALAAAGPVTCGPGHLKPVSDDTHRDFGVQSQMFMSIQPKIGEAWLFGMHQCSHDRIWSDLEQRLFKEIGNRLSDALSASLFSKDLRESEEKHRLFVESFQGIAYQADAITFQPYLFEGTIEEITGYPTADFLANKMNWVSIVHPADLTAVKAQNSRLTSSADYVADLEYRIIHKSGDIRWIRDIARMIRAGESALVQGTIVDITDRKQAEMSLIENENMLRTFVGQSIEALYLHNMTGTLIEVNDTAIRDSGYSHSELMKMSIFDIDPGLHTYDNLAEMWQQLEPFQYQFFQAEHRHKDGSLYPVEIRIGKILLRNTDYLLVLALNITERIRSEEERLTLERQVQHAQKLESLGVLAGGIAHDFNNLLMAILGNADLALYDLPPMSPARHNIEEIERASKRAADLAKQMLAYSGRGKFVVEPINAQELIKEIAHLLEVSISKKTALKFHFTDNAPTFDGDVTQIRQIIMNLITNAAEAIGDEDGVIALSTGVMDCDRTYLDHVNEVLLAGLDEPLPAGRYTYFEVTDTGSGMTAETMDRIFDPFFTTKFTGRGLGMSAVLGIIRGHKGALKISSEIDKGTTFKVLFPASGDIDTKDDLARRAHGEVEPWRGRGTILIADDEETVCSVGGQMLELLGFDVITAPDGREALEVFRTNMDSIVCVLLDLTMPNMGGEEAFHEMRSICPQVSVILCSGYNEQDATHRFAGKGLSGFIQKPFSLTTLREALQAILPREKGES